MKNKELINALYEIANRNMYEDSMVYDTIRVLLPCIKPKYRLILDTFQSIDIARGDDRKLSQDILAALVKE